MAMRRTRSVMTPLAGAALLGGCASYHTTPQRIAYIPAPCTVPGALRVVPAPPPGGTASAAPATAPTMPPPVNDGTASGLPPTDDDRCLVAVAAGRGGYYGAGYPYSYGYPGYYGAPFYGTLGIGIRVGGHARRGHFGGGHFAAGHGGGHRGGGHH